MAMLRGTPVVLSCVCAMHTKGARRSCAHKNMPNTRAEVMKKRQFEWPKLSQLCDLGSASMQIRLSPNFVVLLAHGMNSTQNKFGDYAPARSGSLRLSKSTHLVHIRFRLLWLRRNRRGGSSSITRLGGCSEGVSGGISAGAGRCITFIVFFFCMVSYVRCI